MSCSALIFHERTPSETFMRKQHCQKHQKMLQNIKKYPFYKKYLEKSKVMSGMSQTFLPWAMSNKNIYEKTQRLETPTIFLAYIKIDAIVKYQSFKDIHDKHQTY